MVSKKTTMMDFKKKPNFGVRCSGGSGGSSRSTTTTSCGNSSRHVMKIMFNNGTFMMALLSIMLVKCVHSFARIPFLLPSSTFQHGDSTTITNSRKGTATTKMTKSATSMIFRGGQQPSTSSSSVLASSSSSTSEVETTTCSTTPIEGMKPGTSGLRKKVEVWKDTTNYVENFIQSLLNVAVTKNDGNMLDVVIVAGDGRYYNKEAMQTICQVLAGNGVSEIWVPQHGIMSTPAVSAAIRNLDGGKAKGGILLTASHNPGGPGEDFGIKYNEGLGQPAGEDFTDAAYEESLSLTSYKKIKDAPTIDFSSSPGTEFVLSSTSKVKIIDPFDCYVDTLKQCFDFNALQTFCKTTDFTLLFDGMHGASGTFAKRIFVDELGLPEESLMRCNPLEDFGGCHPDPNLTYASELVKKMGLKPDGSADDDAASSNIPTLGAANDGDGDRNLIAGAGCFVTPSDSLAIICDNWESIPHFSKHEGGPKGVARSMPSSAALDVVAEANNIPCFVTPTGWKFFGNLMSSKEYFNGVDYTPFLCGEESFGTGSDHVREKDGIWAVLAWMSILMNANQDSSGGSLNVGVKDIVTNHWTKYGRHFYCRYDYEGVDTNGANQVMDLMRTEYIQKPISSELNASYDIHLVKVTEFEYTDPVDGSVSSNQGLVMEFVSKNGEPSRVVFRLSGTGSTGATIRMYLEQYERDPTKHATSAPVALQSLANRAIELVQMKQLTGRNEPTVIT